MPTRHMMQKKPDMRYQQMTSVIEKLLPFMSIIEAQSQLLDDVTQDLWNFRYLAMAVSVYRMDGNDAKYKEVIAQYHQETWGILNRLRVNMSKSRRLISENAYRDLVGFYQWLTLEFDQKVRKVIDDDQGHLELNRLIYNEVTTKIDELLYFLANELNLTSDNSAPK